MASNNHDWDITHDDQELSLLKTYNQPLFYQVESMKEDLDDQFQSYHDMLNDKHEQILEQLNDILKSANSMYQKKVELLRTQSDLEEVIKSNELHAVKSKMHELLLTETSELECSISLSEKEMLELEWKHSELESAIEECCFVLKTELVVENIPYVNTFIPYEERKIPAWSTGSIGSDDGQLKEPKGLAIDAENENIYIADRDNNRIVIYDKFGDFVGNLMPGFLIKPHTIVLIDEFCFVACDIPNEGLIIKMNKLNGAIYKSINPGFNLTALTLDRETDLLFGCPLSSPSVLYFQQEDLEKVYKLDLHTTNFTDGTQIHAIDTLGDEIIILFYNAAIPLQSFYRDDGVLLRNIVIPADRIEFASFFTVDSQHNFIVSNKKVKVFSQIGDLIAVIGNDLTKDRAKGEVYGPRGTAITNNGNIVVCDGKRKNSLQMF